MRPAVHGDGRNVASGIESAGTESARQLIADVALHGFKGGREELHAADAMLVAGGKPRLAGRLHHVNDDRIIGVARTFVAADADGQIRD